MDNIESVKKHTRGKRKLFQCKFIITAISLILFAVFVLRWKPKPDPASEMIIKKEIAKQFYKDPNELTHDDFIRVRELLFSKELRDIKFLENLPNLQRLYLDIAVPFKAPPKWMKVLQKLHFYKKPGVKIIDLKPLEKLTNLKELTLIGPACKYIKPVSKLKNLEYLGLCDTNSPNIKPLKNLTNLKELSIDMVEVCDLKYIKNMTNLKSLTLSRVDVHDLELIKELLSIESLKLFDVQVADINAVSKLINLKELCISGSEIPDIEPLEFLTKLENLSISKTNVTNIQPLINLSNIKYLNIMDNQIIDLSPLTYLKNLQKIYLSESQTANLEPLIELEKLETLSITGIPDGRKIILPSIITDLESIKKLKNLKNLELRDVYITTYQKDDLEQAAPGLRIHVSHSSLPKR